MKIGSTFDETFVAHRAPGRNSHPECPERLTSILRELEQTGLAARLTGVPAREATRTELEAAHHGAWLDRLEKTLGTGSGLVDADTYFNEATRSAAWRAAGAAIELATRVARGDLDGGLALLRPPGHHATRDRAMGFCLLNNIAVAARALQASGLARRILIFDWDVHHGNGTEDIFWDDPDVLFVSIHQSPNYPGTGPVTAIGGARAPGLNINVPLPPRSGDEDYVAVFDRVVAPATRWFSPDFVLVSAGYDAWAADPLADMNVSRVGFRALAERTVELAGRSRIVALLEGGYDRSALGGLVADLARALLGERSDGPEIPAIPSPEGAQVIDEVLELHGARWAAGHSG